MIMNQHDNQQQYWRQDIKTNPYLADKDRRNLLILSYVPRLSKWVHNQIMFLKGIKVEK